MTTFELLDFTEARSQVEHNQFQQALPVLYRLAAAYPEDTEIKELLRKALGVPVPTDPSIEPKFVSVKTAETTSSVKTLEIVASGGILLALIGIFLPWLSISFSSDSQTLTNNFNGLAMISRSDATTNIFSIAILNSIGSDIHGVFVLATLGICALVLVIWFVSSNTDTKIVLLVMAIICCGLMIECFISLNGAVSSAMGMFNPFRSSSTYSDPNRVAGIGPGFILTAAGVGVLFISVLAIATSPKPETKPGT